MRLLLLLAVLLCLVPAARAQDSLAVAHPAALASAAAPADTLAALHRLFAHRRGSRTRLVLATVGVAGVIAVATLASGGEFAPAVAVAYTVLAVPIVLTELLFYGQYGRHREQLAVEQFQAHRLPASIRRKLDARYFQPAPGHP